jgi:hypothetical protein
MEQIGMQIMEQAKTMNVSDHGQYMQDITQLALDVSVMEGMMDERLDGTGIYMSMVGLEMEMFRLAAEHYATTTAMVDGSGEEDDDRTWTGGTSGYEDADFGMNGLLLRYIGIGLVVVNFVVVAALTTFARRRRQRIEDHGRNKKNQAANLVTEKAVNQMLETGRRESEKYVLRK